MSKPTLRFHNISPSRLDMYAEQILTSMGKNVDIFETPDPSLDKLQHALNEFRQAVSDASYRDKRAMLVRGQKQVVLQDIIRLLSFYVSKIAKGNESIILAAGFIPSKEPQPVGATPKAENLMAIPEIGTNQIKLRVKPWKSARMYQFEYRKKEEQGDWEIYFSVKSRCTIENLERFAEYEFRVAYVAADPARIYSDVVSCYVV
ncbi:hypothetical protein FAZ19_14835 [Sphingobacterium alkalisoli]|uniref:Fibronectin type III domain-containing protein n=1 Tax=Sphingobacterium alkalisoli TaxID=1874115 RepID=A0A4U0GZ14_9SPHI|nr:hypothetical protein [Sphingobacterium alkalisoli]TJY64471.1 hypothetical protein FAZ19_14835 [Sphingobacterium alkalisoli]